MQAVIEEGIVVGGGCTLLRLASKVDAIKDSLDNDEEKMLPGACNISGQDILNVDCVVVEIKEPKPMPTGNPMGNSSLHF
ncbi:hypothetical protein GOBAR_AA32239 [Gossypium barbadense]|uniref:Uncharacterized protein n=1 Tax=Gossypium barbadense TaxID=3634 RepID=A0A2P5WBH8_GOSBA|nr:hypothetical protein GOBAR_AA32239 [Gossypium barbadense]